MQRITRQRGFTLIELLIVVAIIAILAAIAVPNFLAAQTRAKVSRAQSDMRTISVGLEAFRVDNARYPPDAEIIIGGGQLSYLVRLQFITTPIAYLSSVPADPFATVGRIREFAAERPINPYAFPTTAKDNFIFPLTYDYARRMGMDGAMESDDIWRNISAHYDRIEWAMRSIGPDGWPAWLGEPVPAYDPTNGTISEGNIYWTGPGVGKDAPRL